MGRLTLNILLSFAQFEREIISERTKDKLSAAKKKGKFVGGRPSLGYEVDKIKHRLVVNHKEAEVVRYLFNLYLKEKSALKVARIANEKGYLTKKCTMNGKPAGGIKFTCGTINSLLNNFVYTGKVKTNGEIYPGEHEQIISDEIFNKVQELLQANRLNKNPKRLKHIGLLTRMFFCKTCQKSIYYSYVRKKNYNYACYVCVGAEKLGYDSCATGCLNASRVEDFILNFLRKIVDDKRLRPDIWEIFPIKDKREIFQSFIKKVEYNAKNHILSLTLTKDGQIHDLPINLKVPIIEKIETIEDKIKREPRIRQLLLLAHQIQGLLDIGKAKDLKDISKWLNVTVPRAYQFLNYLRLSPAIQEEIILSANPILFKIPEHRLRKINVKKDYSEQKMLWERLKNSLV